jgi:uncharacterized protein (TIGR03435 family)
MMGVICAQTSPPAPAYTYEVVSIHKSKWGQTRQIISPGTGGGLRTQGTTLMTLLGYAYKVPEQRITGAPGWVTSDRFDVSFTPAKGQSESGPGTGAKEGEAYADRNRQRMQAVLRDRFSLVLRVETHEMPIYALVPARRGLKLTRSVDPKGGPSVNDNGGRVTAAGVTLRFFAAYLSGKVDRPVVDETASDVEYDIKLEYSPEETAHAKPDEAPPLFGGPSIFTALTQQLGLRLESRRGPLPFLVIEKIHRPTEN